MASVCSSTVLMRKPIAKLNHKVVNVIQCHTQASSITTKLKVKIDFTLPELSAKKIMTWNCCVNDSVKGTYDMILGRYILT